jgi:hypothetical protein
MIKLLKRLLKDENVVGFSLVKNKVYVKAPAVIPKEYGEIEIIGEPRPFFRFPFGCSPDFETGDGRFLTAQHCVGIDRSQGEVMMSDKTYAKIIQANPWTPLTRWSLLWCFVEYLLTGKTVSCLNKDWAIIDSGNEFTGRPIGALSGGTEPPGISFFAPFVTNPEEWINKEICGVSYDYDNQQFVLGTWQIADLGVVKYEIDGNIYPVYAWFARGFSKPGFSGTNAFPAGTCPRLPEVKTLEAVDYIVTADKA